MSGYRRVYVRGGSYFFTLVTQHRRPLFSDPALVQRLRDALRVVRRERPFTIDAMVVLPDHLHALWSLPENDMDFSTRWRLIKYRFSLGLPAREVNGSRQRKREKGLWQRRFWEHAIRDERDHQRHLDYIHYNPVKHGLARRPSDWPYSSFRRFVADGVYAADWGALGEPADIEEMVLE